MLSALAHACAQVVPRTRSYLLPRKTRQCKRKTLVLDLDETLVHSSLETPAEACDFAFPVRHARVLPAVWAGCAVCTPP